MNKNVSFRHISEFNQPEQSPGYLLWRISIQWRALVEKALKEHDLTHPQFVVLAALAWLTQDDKEVSQINVGRMAGLDPNTTSQILRGLEKKKIIERTQSVDERSKNPIVTELGRKILEKALPAVEKADALFFKKINQKDIVTLVNLFQKLT
jgi:DNA-binding MarR family transcriptional regulator